MSDTSSKAASQAAKLGPPFSPSGQYQVDATYWGNDTSLATKVAADAPYLDGRAEPLLPRGRRGQLIAALKDRFHWFIGLIAILVILYIVVIRLTGKPVSAVKD